MIIIIVVVYKSCNRNRENELLRREINNTAYAQIFDSNLNQNLAGANYDQSLYANVTFPAPPPPYGLVIGQNAEPCHNTESNARTIPTNQLVSENTATTTNDVPAANTSNRFKPESDVLNSNQPSSSNSNSNNNNNYNNNGRSNHNSKRIWPSFLTGAGVASVTGYFLGRRK
jgi:hypothetical protein